MSAPVPTDAPLIGYRDRVQPEWIDRNDHLNSMHYKTIADLGMRALFAVGGLTRDYLEAEQKSVFQLEMHICYEHELRLGQVFEIHSWLIAADNKRLHHFHEIYHSESRVRAATVELMTIFIDRTTRRSADFPPEMYQRFKALAVAHAAVPQPDKISRRIAMQAWEKN